MSSEGSSGDTYLVYKKITGSMIVFILITEAIQMSAHNIIWDVTWQNQQNDCAPSKDSDQPGHPPSLIRVFAAQWVAKDPRFLHADSEDSDQTGRMHRLIWVFAGRTFILLVLSCSGSFMFSWRNIEKYLKIITKHLSYLFHCLAHILWLTLPLMLTHSLMLFDILPEILSVLPSTL